MKYQIVGEPLPVAICTVEPGQALISERGSMSWMTPNMKMETKGTGGLGKMIGRMASGESAFQNRFTAEGGEGMVAFASSFPGSIRAYEISPGNEMVVQKSGFLASDEGVELSVILQNAAAVYADYLTLPVNDGICADNVLAVKHNGPMTHNQPLVKAPILK